MDVPNPASPTVPAQSADSNSPKKPVAATLTQAVQTSASVLGFFTYDEAWIQLGHKSVIHNILELRATIEQLSQRLSKLEAENKTLKADHEKRIKELQAHFDDMERLAKRIH